MTMACLYGVKKEQQQPSFNGLETLHRMQKAKCSPRKKAKLESVEENLVFSGTYGGVDHPVPISTSASSGDKDADLPSDFLEPLSPQKDPDDGVSSLYRPVAPWHSLVPEKMSKSVCAGQASKQFWKAGDYEGNSAAEQKTQPGGMDHVRVHPKFLHSNATSHKWALGAVAELLDNALDEVANGATFVNIDTLSKQGEASHMLLVEDNGGGMDPDCIRHCVSLGYSAKSKMTNTIGQYGNGFKTSTMRLGADVIVFSRSRGRNGHKPTASIGLLSYTFLRETGQQDIFVPMVDFYTEANGLQKLIKTTADDWKKNMETIKQWSPFVAESDLMDQLNAIGHQGTRIIVYNLWEDDQGELELDFDTDPHDIQVRGVNRDPNCISLAERLPSSKHFLTYRHSLRSYASILYLWLPKNFKMILRGQQIKHHCLVDDLMFTQKHTYRPHGGGQLDDEQETAHQHDSSQMKAIVTIGFVKDAKEHMDVQGFNVYHKNRLIKPFWRIWNSASSQGRGIIGVLEANFVEPAHDKQGFEKTTVLARLEARLLKMQKTYWSKYCHKVGYVNYHSRKKQLKAATKKGKKSLHNVRAKNISSPKQPHKLLRSVSGNDNVHPDPSQDDELIPQKPRGDYLVKTLFPKVFPRALRSLRQRPSAQKYGSNSVSGSVLKDEDALTHSCAAGEMVHSSHSESLQVRSTQDQDTTLKNSHMKEMDDCSRKRKLLISNGTYEATMGECCDPMGNTTSDSLENIRRLELQLVDMEQELEAMQNKMEEAIKERDLLRQELEEERNQAERNDSEMRKKLRDTIVRVKELEATNSRLQLALYTK